MIDRVKKELERIEKEANITIHFACESGSRGWGFASPDSDYDVRFIYSRPQHQYMSIRKMPDFIEIPIFDNLDIGGWDIKKVLVLLHGSNAVIFEWLQSPIIYREKDQFQARLFELAAEYFSPRKTLHHYLGLCKKSLTSGFQDVRVKVKTYFYVLRPLLSAMWISEHGGIPPMEFSKLLALIEDNRSLKEEIGLLLEKKKAAAEKDLVPVIPQLQEFIESRYENCLAHADSLPMEKKDPEPLDVFFRGLLTR
jgi:predicted nucleotidyltransferase